MCAWQPISRVSIGKVRLNTNEIQSFSLEDYVPSDAKEVLIFATISTGHFSNAEDKVGYMTMWTSNGPLKYEKYLSYHMYPQNAWSTNSDNMFFPVTPNKTLHLSFDTLIPEDGGKFINVYVTGYRI